MTATQLEDPAQRRARVCAEAAEIADLSPAPQRFVLTPGRALTGSRRKRVNASKSWSKPSRDEERRYRPRRSLAIGILLFQLLALAAILTTPVFEVGNVSVNGGQLLNQETLIDVAGVPAESIFLIDGEEIRQRLEQFPWVRSATVVTELPSTVRVTVSERSPVLRLQRGGNALFVADDGNAVRAQSTRRPARHDLPLAIDDRPIRRDRAADGDEHGGVHSALDADLVKLLQLTSAHFSTLFGTQVVALRWQPDETFVIWTAAGWGAIFGRLETKEQVGEFPKRMAALAALHSQLDFAKPQFGYIDLENLASPTVGGSPGLPPDLRARLGLPAPAPAPSPPAATQAATPSPTPAASPPAARATAAPVAPATHTPTPARAPPRSRPVTRSSAPARASMPYTLDPSPTWA